MKPHLPALLATLSACSAPNTDEMFSTAAVAAAEGDESVVARFVTEIEAATETLHVALPAGGDTALSDALIAAAERGVEVEVVTDVDRALDPAIAALEEAEVPTYLADGPLSYFDFSSNHEIAYASTEVLMTHAFVVRDGTYYVAANTIGTTGGWRLLFSGHNEELGEDLRAEHNQIFGGTDATAVDAYDAMAKSIADARWRYGTQTDTDLEMWLGPQERLGKRVIDAIYSARSSVRILTDDLANEGLARALQEKAADGFDVQVIVGPSFGTASADLSEPFEDDTPDVEKWRVTGVDQVPTIVLVDFEGGAQTTVRAMTMSHSLYSCSRETIPTQDPDEPYIGTRTDQLIDGNMWVLDAWGEPTSMMAPLEQVYTTHLDMAEEL